MRTVDEDDFPALAGRCILTDHPEGGGLSQPPSTFFSTTTGQISGTTLQLNVTRDSGISSRASNGLPSAILAAEAEISRWSE